MKSLVEYIKSIFKGLWTLLIGMKITLKEFFTPKVTQCYPENRETLKIADRFRATLVMITDENVNNKCTACGLCSINCPNQTIKITSHMEETEEGKKKKVLDAYLYDIGSCTFCQLCVEGCPTKAIEFTNDFEQAVFTRSKLVKQLNKK